MRRWRRCLIILTVFISLLLVIGLWLFRTESVVLTALPGETVSVYDIPAISAHQARLGAVEAKIYRNRLEGSFSGYQCKDGMILEKLNDSEGNNDVTLINNCSESVTIEIWWYSLRILNPFIAS